MKIYIIFLASILVSIGFSQIAYYDAIELSRNVSESSNNMSNGIPLIVNDTVLKILAQYIDDPKKRNNRQ
jgi:hypothetical protein